MSPQEAIPILKRLQEPEAWEPQISRDAYEALELAIEALSKHQADKKLFGHGYWLVPGEVFISHNVLNEVLNTITKSINTEQRKIDSTLVKTVENDEAIRTDDHIADDSKMVDQFRDTTKKTDDVPDIHVGKIPYKKPEIIRCTECKKKLVLGNCHYKWEVLSNI